MPVYRYKGRDSEGRLVKRKIEKDNPGQVIEYMRACGCVGINVKEASFFDTDITKRVTKKDIAVFCRQFSYLQETGVPIINALNILQGQTECKKLKVVLGDINERVLKGEALSESMDKHPEFPALLKNMIRVGEISGRLSAVLESMADYYEKEYRRAEEIRSALIYPFVVSLILFVVIIIAVVYLVPNYAAIYAENSAALPLPTSLLISFSRFLTLHAFKLLTAFVLLIMLFFIFIRTPQGKYATGSLKLKIPAVKGIYKKTVNARFAEVMSILLNAAYPVTESLSTVKLVLNNTYINSFFDDIITQVESGSGLADAIEGVGLFDSAMCKMMKIGEESGRLLSVLDKCKDYLNLELSSAISRFSKLIEPAIILSIGLLLGFVMLAIMLPAFNLGNIL